MTVHFETRTYVQRSAPLIVELTYILNSPENILNLQP